MAGLKDAASIVAETGRQAGRVRNNNDKSPGPSLELEPRGNKRKIISWLGWVGMGRTGIG